MSRSLYIVSYSWYEEYSPTILEGPTVGDWKSYCDALIPQAALIAIEKQKTNKYPSWIGWIEIVDELINILITENGYERVNLSNTDYWGSSIIRDELDSTNENISVIAPVLQQIVDHNKWVEDKLDKEYEE